MPIIQKPGTTVALPKTGPSGSGLRTMPLDIATGPAKALGEVGQAIGGIGDMAQKAMFRLEQQNDQDAKMIYNTASLKDDAERLEWFNKIKTAPAEDRLSVITQAKKAFMERPDYADLKNIDEKGFGLYYSEKAIELGDSGYVRRAQEIYKTERAIKDKKFRAGVSILQTEARQAIFVKQGKETQTQILLDLNNGTTYDSFEDAAFALDMKLDNLSTYTDDKGNVHRTVPNSIVAELKEDLSKSLILGYAGQQLRELNVPFATELVAGIYDKALLNSYDNSTTKLGEITVKAQRVIDNQMVSDLKALHEADYMKDPEGERAIILAGKEPDHIKESAIADLEAIVARDERDERRRWQEQRDDAAQYLIPGTSEYDKEKARDIYITSDLPNEEIARKVKALNSGNDALPKSDPEILTKIKTELHDPTTIDKWTDTKIDDEVYKGNLISDDAEKIKQRRKEIKDGTNTQKNSRLKIATDRLKQMHLNLKFIIPESTETDTAGTIIPTLRDKKRNDKRYSDLLTEVERRSDHGENALEVVDELTKPFEEENIKALLDKFDDFRWGFGRTEEEIKAKQREALKKQIDKGELPKREEG
ncbi:MAG TPA: hypothetical protein ENH40_02880, partial [Nitrospirae bacterium]|nr:hypothetical protein [Nitrospirota bacterium]